MDFYLLQSPFAKAVAIRSNKQSHEIVALKISFASDGFPVLTAAAKSEFTRALDGKMWNIALALLDQDQWVKLWRIFQQSGVVTVDAAFLESHVPTQGFAQTVADFSQCIEQLDLITQENK